MVEDNDADVNLVREALEEHGVRCELIVITNGEAAIHLVERIDAAEIACPDLVILDLNLPRRPGSEVLRRIRESCTCAPVPVLVLTSSDSRRDRDEAARLGASRYLCKPSRLNEFLELGRVFREMLSEKAN